MNQVFGWEEFRPVQEQVIQAVVEGKDTLALMPTGGGKSLCYQVPGLVKEGICIVVSPLIALMKDQVDQLRSKGVLAAAVFSGMSYKEIDRTLDNCVHGDYKFLYVSPERLKSELFLERFKQMNVNLIAVDEAHCISQWGHDFRPSYLEISAIRVFQPEVKVLALTATATPQVEQEILERLEMKSPAVFRQSFARENLSFSVRLAENKLEKGKEILSRVDGTAIWYVRNRQATHQIAKALNQLGVKAGAYHAGMKMDLRNQQQEAWMKNQFRVMVSTNAFGMGIDKPDVRVVIHSDLPENLENYYQEAGRAGRDGKKSFAVILSNEEDMELLLKRADLVYPPLDFVKKVYQCLANYFRIAVGSNMLSSFDFEWSSFAETYNLGVLETFYALKVLEEEGFIGISESFFSPSKLHILVSPQQLYEVQISHAALDPLVKLLLRTYGGNLFSEYLKINESKLAKNLETSEAKVIKSLQLLAKLEVMDYEERKDKPQITFLTSRYDAGKLPLNFKRIELRRELTKSKANEMVTYTRQKVLCRTQFIQEYFGEHTDKQCGVCDWCVAQKKDPTKESSRLKSAVLETLKQEAGLVLEKLMEKMKVSDADFFLKLLREMLDEGLLTRDVGGKFNIEKR
ncbi:ATP-dependent DNA helicase RecQ [Algoriphagus vanfongensis]|uniref:RecQ family ATP-dependent DNA helicase n=1 Tax=Algoriphagus vanfongensis TaxID=426371 RepID=UPI0003FB7EDF